MAETVNDLKIYPIQDFSGGQQTKSSRFLQKETQVQKAENIVFD